MFPIPFPDPFWLTKSVQAYRLLVKFAGLGRSFFKKQLSKKKIAVDLLTVLTFFIGSRKAKSFPSSRNSQTYFLFHSDHIFNFPQICNLWFVEKFAFEFSFGADLDSFNVFFHCVNILFMSFSYI